MLKESFIVNKYLAKMESFKAERVTQFFKRVALFTHFEKNRLAQGALLLARNRLIIM